MIYSKQLTTPASICAFTAREINPIRLSYQALN